MVANLKEKLISIQAQIVETLEKNGTSKTKIVIGYIQVEK